MIKAANAHTSTIGRLQAQFGAIRSAEMAVCSRVWGIHRVTRHLEGYCEKC